jgi:hypothetical protein
VNTFGRYVWNNWSWAYIWWVLGFACKIGYDNVGCCELPSHAIDGIAKSCYWWRCQGDIGHGMMSLPSHTGDGIAESCWWWRCWGNVGHSVISLLSHVGDGATDATLAMAWHHYWAMLAFDVVRYRCQCMLVMALSSLAGAAEATLVVAWCRCRVILVMALPSVASDGATEYLLEKYPSCAGQDYGQAVRRWSHPNWLTYT